MALPHQVLQEQGIFSIYLYGASIAPECHADGQGEPLHDARVLWGMRTPHPKSQPVALY